MPIEQPGSPKAGGRGAPEALQQKQTCKLDSKMVPKRAMFNPDDIMFKATETSTSDRLSDNRIE